MKRFKTFVFEQTANIDDIAQAIKKDCAHFLHISKTYPLYRGIKFDPATTFVQIDHPKNRDPLDSSKKFNLMFNFIVESGIGINDIRRRTIFCTGDLKQASIYGELCFIFPKGQFKFIWSPSIYDSFSAEWSISKRFASYLMAELNFLLPNDFNKKMLNFWKQASEIGSSIFLDAEKLNQLLQNNGIIFDAKTVDIVNVMSTAGRKTFEEIYKTSGMRQASDSLNEILIYESNGYYAVNCAVIAKQLNIDIELPYKVSQMDNLYDVFLSKINS